jgi:hypothetical protein
MAVPFTQLVATTYDDVVTERGKAADQWSDSSFLKYLERKGGVKRTPGGATLQPTLDYRANALTDFLATDVTATGITKTDVITAASYGWATLVTPVNWSLTDEALNSEPNQKVDLAASLVNNALASHDQAVETGMFSATATDGFLTLQLIADPAGTGNIGTIDAAVETWWANKFGLWLDASIIADLTTVWNKVAKGSSGRTPNVIACSATSHAVLEGKLVPQQRYGSDDTTGRAGFNALQFKTSDVVFSMGCTVDSFYMFNTQDLKLYVVSSAWRERRQAVEMVDHAMMNMKLFSVLQLATNCRSRVGVVKKGP